MTGDEGAALDTSADIDTSDPGDSGAEAATGLDSTPSNDNGGETASEKRARLKLKWLGREEEVDADELAKRFSDDYEYEFKGPGGKPMKARWPDIERHVQLSAGAKAAIQRAKEQQDQWRQQVEWGKAPENRLAALEQMWGIEDAEEWAYEIAAQKVQREAELAQLAQADPLQYHRRMQQMLNEKNAHRQRYGQQQQQRAQQEAQRRAEGERQEQAVKAELKAAGVAVTPHNVARAWYISRENRELGIELEPRQMAAILRKELDSEILGHLDSLPPEKLLAYLGDKRRGLLREAELAATKAAKKAQSAGSAPASNGAKKADSGGDAFEKAIRNMQRGA